MAEETTPTSVQPAAIELAAAALRGDTTVAKANPVKDEAEETQEVAKAEDPKDEDKTEEVAKAEAPAPFEKKDDNKQEVKKALDALDLPGLIQAAITAAVAPVQAELAEVRKSLGVVEASTQATMQFQSATTGILTSLKDEVEEQREVQKSVAATVEAVAAQPAGRKSAPNDVEVAKSVAVSAPTINLQPLRDWAKEANYDVAQRVTFVRNAEAGNFTGVPSEVRKAMGVQ